MKTVLIAEDDPASRELLRELLSSYGYEVVEAVDGQEAWRMIRDERPALVLLDIQMPVMDGFDVIRLVRQDTQLSATPVVAVTAYAMRGDMEKGMAAGFDAYLTKPVENGKLKAQLDELLG